jgi:glutathione synthase
MSNKILFITDPVSTLNVSKDTSLFMVEHAQRLGISSFQCATSDISFQNASVKACAYAIELKDKEILLQEASEDINLKDFKCVFMRKDPPVDQDYMNTLHLLDLASSEGANIINDPSAVKKFNEKIFALYFAKYIPNTIITSKVSEIKSFAQDFNEIVIKPLNGMGGESIYKLNEIGSEEEAIIEDLTNQGSTSIVGQEFLPEIYDGDFRILIINGKPFQKTLARIPQGGSFKGNLAAGGKGVAQDLKPHQEAVATEIGEVLVKNGILFAGLDMIGSKVTEINVTSPTCAREIFEQTGEDPIKELFSNL